MAKPNHALLPSSRWRFFLQYSYLPLRCTDAPSWDSSPVRRWSLEGDVVVCKIKTRPSNYRIREESKLSSHQIVPYVIPFSISTGDAESVLPELNKASYHLCSRFIGDKTTTRLFQLIYLLVLKVMLRKQHRRLSCYKIMIALGTFVSSFSV